VEIIPAIDIRGGLCVRLTQGDYARETVYDADPVAVARRWQEQGATRLHVVDLDGARAGSPQNEAVIGRILQATSVPVEVGGGIRSEADASRYRELGAARVILGTAAVEDQALVQRLAARFGDALLVGIDARDGVVMTRGWLNSGDVRAVDLARTLTALGVARYFYTDIGQDGMLAGPNVGALRAFVAAAGRPVIASGGVSRREHVFAVSEAGAEAAIVGRALYTGDLSLADALAAAASSSAHPLHA
jgi:phosphoribosylformimino-5-aminoimidazole carboxamide ribotide isomerase